MTGIQQLATHEMHVLGHGMSFRLDRSPRPSTIAAQ
jgi:hypothetical protein